MPSDFSQRDLCPIDSDTQQWIDARVSWILHEFGRERIKDCRVVVPTVEFFPAPFRESESDARVLLDQLSAYLGIDSQSIQLAFFYEGDRADGGPTAAGLFEEEKVEETQFRIWVEYSELHDPISLAGTIVHELCHVHLLGHRRLTPDEDDHEPLTDLLAIFLGLGVILSNSVLRDSTKRMGHFEHWRIRRHGYLTMPMCGYALAMFSQIRGEHSPKWTSHLRPDVRDAFHRSLTYFRHRGLPEFRTVVTTAARPTLYTSEKVGPEEDEAVCEPQPDALDRCHFCGVTLAGEDHGGVCDDCKVSIEENQEDIELERQRQEAEWQTKQNIVRSGCFIIVVSIAIFALLDWLNS